MQIYTSKSLEGLDYQKKYILKEYTDVNEHLYLFGLYRTEDIEVIYKHNGPITIVWCGSDAKNLNQNWLPFVMDSHISHIAISNFIQDRLWSLGIESEYKPINAVIKSEWDNEPNGDCVYFYTALGNSGKIYNDHFIEEIEKRTGLEVIVTHYGKTNRQVLKNLYKKCFINCRLTDFDGTPHTNIEMGLMGRKSIFNGNLPHSIKWSGIEDICESIMKEYELRHLPNKHVSEAYKNLDDKL